MRLLRNEPLKKHTSFRIGGPADYFCIPRNMAELKDALVFARERGLGTVIIGAGTNLLVLDQGFRGVVVKLAGGLNWIRVNGGRIEVGAGVHIAKLLQVLGNKKLGGLEFLAGIPGTVGGAIVMNAGAWGKEIADYVEQVLVIDRAGRQKILKRRVLGFGYRRSRLQGSRWILAQVVLKLRKKKRGLIRRKVRENLIKRKAAQPLGIPNCGSVFKNPKGDFAGRLIQEAGCKGMRIGDAQVSAKHANFIVNLGDARARDVIKLMTSVQKKVKDRFKIRLEPEIKIMVKSPS
ncbi:MAG: UDP-N-acetylmuramate dehydrogenase [Candidatus Margulisbacteria bacterium]|nr:UDP-N-acetylmuramate dehydrogenase [Candidatus Margulisiibacteriota bacterium]